MTNTLNEVLMVVEQGRGLRAVSRPRTSSLAGIYFFGWTTPASGFFSRPGWRLKAMGTQTCRASVQVSGSDDPHLALP